MFPELAGYPSTHQCVCYSENDSVSPEMLAIMAEVAE